MVREYDVYNPHELTPRVIYSAEKKTVRINPGETKRGVLLDEEMADRINARKNDLVAKVSGSGKSNVEDDPPAIGVTRRNRRKSRAAA